MCSGTICCSSCLAGGSLTTRAPNGGWRTIWTTQVRLSEGAALRRHAGAVLGKHPPSLSRQTPVCCRTTWPSCCVWTLWGTETRCTCTCPNPPKKELLSILCSRSSSWLEPRRRCAPLHGVPLQTLPLLRVSSGGLQPVPRAQVLHGSQENQPGRRHAGVGARALRDPPAAGLHPVPPAVPPPGSALQHHGRAVSVPHLSPRSGRAPCWVGSLLHVLWFLSPPPPTALAIRPSLRRSRVRLCVSSLSLTVCERACFRPHVDVNKLGRNTKVVAEALARVIYNLTEKVARADGHTSLGCLFLSPPPHLYTSVTLFVFVYVHRAPPPACRSSPSKWYNSHAAPTSPPSMYSAASHTSSTSSVRNPNPSPGVHTNPMNTLLYIRRDCRWRCSTATEIHHHRGACTHDARM